MNCPICKTGEVRVVFGNLACNRFPICRHVEAAPVSQSAAAGFTYAIYDVETTGRSNEDKIIQIGAAKVRDGMIIEEFDALINPGRYISPIITQLTGITNADLIGKPPEEEVIPRFLQFLSDVEMLGAHNLPFDARFLKHACTRIGVPNFSGQGFCTLAMAKKAYPGHSHKLGDLCAAIGFDLNNAHNALYDVRGTVKVAENMIAMDQILQPKPFSEFCKK